MIANGQLEELAEEVCLRLLRGCGVGRIGVVVDGVAVITPVNYRMLEDGAGVGLVVRTRPGSIVDQALDASFEIDGVDPVHRQGWSVLVRGTLGHITDTDVGTLDEIDPDPWVADRNCWLVLRPLAIAGRQLLAPEIEWELSLHGYL